jgi:hypothetical protein
VRSLAILTGVAALGLAYAVSFVGPLAGSVIGFAGSLGCLVVAAICLMAGLAGGRTGT